ncbi:hypothetical protein JCGZ_09145 [Jatropha curcas]|uniref:Pentacotripeptide-repeat region of PRORP domain-containing protein n=2 Tax=Jatropha curcas TaxID=180498 RepID=A0A067KFF8_JATCU|nr:hypothetical protein JCGZ_09145 [Jatropha curcas]
MVEQEFVFKPSFDEYLKVMESVKTGQEKKELRKFSGSKLKEDTRGRNERYNRSADGENKSKENGGIDQNDMINDELDNKERGIRESSVKLPGKESSGGTYVKRKVRGVTGEVQRLNYQTRRMHTQLEDFHQGKGKKTQSLQESRMMGVVESRKSPIGNEEEFSYGKNLPKFFQRKNTEREEHGARENRMRFVSNHVRIDRDNDEEIVRKRGFLIRSNSRVPDNGSDKDLEVERSAFRSFEEGEVAIARPRTSRMEMEERIQKLAKCLNGADIDMPEWMFSKMMRSARIKYTDHTILRIIQILGKLGNWRRVLQVIEWLQMRERFKSYRLRDVYTTALYVLGKAQRPVEALNVFHAMQQQMSSYPDLVAYRSIAVTLGQAGRMEQLFDVIENMRSPPKKKFKMAAFHKWDPRLEPDVIVYNAVLNACVQRKQWEGAFWVLQQLKQQGLQPSTATYGLIMEVMHACGKYNLVHEFFMKVQKSSIPNALVYRVLVKTLWKEGRIDEAVLAVETMERRGIVGSAALYYDLARCLCGAGRCQEALHQVEKICKVANKPLVVTYTGLIQACLDSGNIQNAVYIFNQMKHVCSPNLVTCNIMLKAYLEHGLFEEAKDLFHKMSEDSNYIKSKADYKVKIMPDIYTFNTMLDACIAEKNWDDFEYFYGRMLHNGYHFNVKRHLRMVLNASGAGKGEAVEMTWKHLAQAGRTPPPTLVKERFCIMLKKGNCDSALACITNNAIEESPAFSETAWLNLLEENAQQIRRDTLVQLMDEVSILVHRSSPPNPILQTLLTSCNNFLEAPIKVPEDNHKEIVCTVQS